MKKRGGHYRKNGSNQRTDAVTRHGNSNRENTDTDLSWIKKNYDNFFVKYKEKT